MNWFEVIKENRLVTDTVTHTKVDEEKEPEKEDGRCKRKLIEVCEGIDKFFIDLKSQQLVKDYDMHLWPLTDTLAEKINKLPEEVCCLVLEKLKSMNIDRNPSPIPHQKLWKSQGSGRVLIGKKDWYIRSQFTVRPKEMLFIISVDNNTLDSEGYITGPGETPFEVYFLVALKPSENPSVSQVDMSIVQRFARRFNELV